MWENYENKQNKIYDTGNSEGFGWNDKQKK